MTFPRIALLTLLVTGSAIGGASVSYTLEPQAVDHGGLSVASANYSASFSGAPGGAGASSYYESRSGYAGQLLDQVPLPPVTFIPPASLAADGGPKNFTATSSADSGFTFSYAGRGVTTYGPSSNAPSLVGLYTVTATPTSYWYSGSSAFNFVISGPLPATDFLTKPADHASILIAASELLTNDSRLLASGTFSSAGLTVTGVAAGAGNAVYLGTGLDAGWILFVPSHAASETFTYTVSDGVSSASVAVTVSAVGSMPTFQLHMVKRGTATFDGSQTTSSLDFAGVPGQQYQVEYSTDLAQWLSAGTISTGPTGSFTVLLSRPGNFAAAWNSSLFFRARR
jgi:hypothetical protein